MLSLSFSLMFAAVAAPLSGSGYPQLIPATTTTDTIIGEMIGTLRVAIRVSPRLVPVSATTDAALGDIIGTIRM